MNKGDAPAMILYPPDELSDEAVWAMSEFLHEMCRAFEHNYNTRINRHINVLERDAKDRMYTGSPNVTWDEEEPF